MRDGSRRQQQQQLFFIVVDRRWVNRQTTLRFFLLYCSDCYSLIEQRAKATKECPESTIDNFLWETQRKEEMRRKLD